MLTHLEVRNFRGFESLGLEALTRINLLIGRNGTGKTSLLEALWLLGGGDNPELGIRIDSFRGLPYLPAEIFFRNLFRDFKTDRHIEISADGDHNRVPCKLEITMRERQTTEIFPLTGSEALEGRRLTSPHSSSENEIVFTSHLQDGTKFESRAWLGPGRTDVHTAIHTIHQERQRLRGKAICVFLASRVQDNLEDTAKRFGQIQLLSREDRILDFLRVIEPRLVDLVPIVIGDMSLIHAHLENSVSPVPLQLLGDCACRIFGLALAMHAAQGGLLLVDEIENGLHCAVQEAVFAHLLAMAQAYDCSGFCHYPQRRMLTGSEQCHRRQRRGAIGGLQNRPD